MAEDNSAVMPNSKADVFAKVMKRDQFQAEIDRCVNADLNEPWKQPVLLVLLFHCSGATQSVQFVQHFGDMVDGLMNIYGFKVRYVLVRVNCGDLKIDTFDFGVDTFPTVLLMGRDKSKAVKFDLQTVNGGSNKSPDNATQCTHGFNKFVEKIKKGIEEALKVH